MSDALALRMAQSLFEQHYADLVHAASGALRNRIAARPADREELIQNTLCHVWSAWLSVCRRNAFLGMPPRQRLLRLVHWQAKLRRTFGHAYRNRFSAADGSHGCIPVEAVMQQQRGVHALTVGQTADCRQRVVETGEVVADYRKLR